MERWSQAWFAEWVVLADWWRLLLMDPARTGGFPGLSRLTSFALSRSH